MRTTKKLFALLLAAVLCISTLGINADAQNTADTVTVTLKVEDVDSTLISEQVTLTKDDVKKINNTFVVESGSVEIPVLTSEDFTAANVLGKYITDTSDSPAADLTFSYGSPLHIKGQETYDYFPYWSFRVNNTAPAARHATTPMPVTGVPIQNTAILTKRHIKPLSIHRFPSSTPLMTALAEARIPLPMKKYRFSDKPIS